MLYLFNRHDNKSIGTHGHLELLFKKTQQINYINNKKFNSDFKVKATELSVMDIAHRNVYADMFPSYME